MPIIAAYYNGSDLGNVSYQTSWFWAGWVFQTSSSPPLLEKIGFQRNSSYTPGTGDWIAVAVARLDANNQIIEVAAYKQWVGAEIGSGGAAAVWHTISPIGLQPNTKYAVLYARNSNAVSAVNKFPAQGSAITVDGTTVATIEGQHSVSGLGAGPQLSTGGTVTISTAAPTWSTAGNWGQLISLSVPDPLPLPTTTLIAEATLDGSPELIDVEVFDIGQPLSLEALTSAELELVDAFPIEMSQSFSSEVSISTQLELIDLDIIEMGNSLSAEVSVSIGMEPAFAEGYYFATAPIVDDTPDSVVVVAGVLRGGVWYWSNESAVCVVGANCPKVTSLSRALINYTLTLAPIANYSILPVVQPTLFIRPPASLSIKRSINIFTSFITSLPILSSKKRATSLPTSLPKMPVAINSSISILPEDEKVLVLKVVTNPTIPDGPGGTFKTDPDVYLLYNYDNVDEGALYWRWDDSINWKQQALYNNTELLIGKPGLGSSILYCVFIYNHNDIINLSVYPIFSTLIRRFVVGSNVFTVTVSPNSGAHKGTVYFTGIATTTDFNIKRLIVRVDDVDFYIENLAQSKSENFDFVIDTIFLSNGPHLVSVLIEDIYGGIGGTSFIMIIDNTIPKVDVTEKIYISDNASVLIQGTAYDDISNISKVEYTTESRLPILLCHYESGSKGVDGEVAVVPSGTPTYAAGKFGSGILLDTGKYIQYGSTEFDINNGSIDLWAKPQWNGNDNTAHYFIDIADEANYNRIRLYKDSSNILHFAITDSAGTTTDITTSVSAWAQATLYHVQIGCSLNQGTKKCKMYMKVGGALIQELTDKTIYISKKPGFMTIGADYLGANTANSIIDELRSFDIYDSVSSYAASSATGWQLANLGAGSGTNSVAFDFTINLANDGDTSIVKIRAVDAADNLANAEYFNAGGGV